MKRLDVIPKPNKVEFLGGEVDPSELEITYIEDKSLADEAYVLTVVKSGRGGVVAGIYSEKKRHYSSASVFSSALVSDFFSGHLPLLENAPRTPFTN